ncbi:DUF4157 domain-containing protein [Mycobacterium sp. OTB74]|uniref:eCIS core domain-containing protein n=1 Tax=Mycobacterium sp. OTB74 TaxID=1853452 RepID=UPI002473302E|nr:DUF4157 domain-containing protein [Mycobacterium sp. OTB74]MDH6243227.1 hypothetical protein [Mycobacterium sp. OTB74]
MYASQIRAAGDRAGAEIAVQNPTRRPAANTGMRPSSLPTIQRCGTDTSCGCSPHEQMEGAERHLQRATLTGGKPLPSASKRKMQQAFSFNFDAVRVHTGAAASQAADALDARAMTTGTDIVFGAGEFAPGTAGGDRLLAHELAHVVQQSQGLVRRPLDGGPTDGLERAAHLAAERATPAAEHEADGAARIVATGGAVSPLSRQPRAIARQGKGGAAAPPPPSPTTVVISPKADPVAVRQNAQDFVNNIAAKYGSDGGHTQVKNDLAWNSTDGRVTSITSTWAIAENYPSVMTGPGATVAANELAACRDLADRLKQHEDKHAAIEKQRREAFLRTFVGSADSDASARVETLECQIGQAQRALDCAEGKITLDANNKVSVSGVDHPEYIGANCAPQFSSGGCGTP